MKTGRSPHSSYALACNRAAVPIQDCAAPLKLCIILKQHKNDWEPVLVRHHSDFQVLLSGLVDATGTVHLWTELWVQRALKSEGTLENLRSGIDNHALDRRWSRTIQSWQQNLPGEVIALPEPLGPLWIDANSLTPWRPADPELGNYRLCTDDLALARASLPAYSTSLQRYLIASREDQVKLLSLNDPEAATDSIPSITQLFPHPQLIPINPEGAAVLVRKFVPLSLETLTDFISGMPAEESLSPELSIAGLTAPDAGGSNSGASDCWLFSSQSGPASRIVESLYLRLSLLKQALQCVHAHIKSTQSPLLGLTSSSFRVDLNSHPSIAPWLWTSRVHLLDPGDAAEVRIAGVDARFFLPIEANASPYRAIGSSRQLEGRGTLRLREVHVEGSSDVTVMGTLSTQDRLRVDANDLILLRVAIGRVQCQLCAKLEEDTTLVAGEWRVRSIPQKLPANVIERFQEFQGYAVPDVPFELIQSMGTPCDVYSMAIVCLRVLLVNSRRKLPTVIDDFASFVSEVRNRSESGTRLVDAIEAIFKSDPRWLERLGPANLSHEPDTTNSSAIPLSFWREVMACIVRMIPGQLKESHLENFSDAPEGAVHRVFDATIHDWTALSAQARSLLTLDWRANREIDAILRAEQGLPVGQPNAFAASAAKPPSSTGPSQAPAPSTFPTRSPALRPRDAVVIQRGSVQDKQ